MIMTQNNNIVEQIKTLGKQVLPKGRSLDSAAFGWIDEEL